MEPDLGYCNVCETPSTLICSRCSDTYCSIECQLHDWQNHRFICLPLPKLIERSTVDPRKLVFFPRNAQLGDTSKDRGSALRNKVELPRLPKHVSKVNEPEEMNEVSLLISTLIDLGNKTLVGRLSVSFTENLFSVVVDFPPVLAQKYNDLMGNLNTKAAGFKSSKIAHDAMIVVNGARAIVISFDMDANAAVIYYCDFGTFDLLMPLPEIKLCPSEYLQMPPKTVLVELISLADQNRDQFMRNFSLPKNIFSFDIRQKSDAVFNAQVNINGKSVGHVSLYESMPNLELFNIPGWKVKIESGTKVIITRLNIDSEIHVFIVPIAKIDIYAGLLHKIRENLERYKTIPNIDDLVVHIEESRGTRLLITKHLPNFMVEGIDVDNGRNYKCEWNQLMKSNDFVKNLPLYGMNVKISDAPKEFDKAHAIELLKTIDYRNKEFIAEISGDVKLIFDNESLGLMIENYANHKKLTANKDAQVEEIKKREEKVKQQEKEQELQLKKFIQEAELKQAGMQKCEDKELRLKNLAEKDKKWKEKCEKHGKIFYTDMNVIPLEVGKTSKFIVTNGLKDSFMGVCEDSVANTEYLEKILLKCEEYASMVRIKDLVGYRPVVTEMCLVRYSDGAWYRAECVASSGSEFIMLLVDFGLLSDIAASKIMPLPESLKEPPPRSHFVTLTVGDLKKWKEIEEYGKYRFTVVSFEDDIYNLTFA